MLWEVATEPNPLGAVAKPNAVLKNFCSFLLHFLFFQYLLYENLVFCDRVSRRILRHFSTVLMRYVIVIKTVFRSATNLQFANHKIDGS